MDINASDNINGMRALNWKALSTPTIDACRAPSNLSSKQQHLYNAFANVVKAAAADIHGTAADDRYRYIVDLIVRRTRQLVSEDSLSTLTELTDLLKSGVVQQDQLDSIIQQFVVKLDDHDAQLVKKSVDSVISDIAFDVDGSNILANKILQQIEASRQSIVDATSNLLVKDISRLFSNSKQISNNEIPDNSFSDSLSKENKNKSSSQHQSENITNRISSTSGTSPNIVNLLKGGSAKIVNKTKADFIIKQYGTSGSSYIGVYLTKESKREKTQQQNRLLNFSILSPIKSSFKVIGHMLWSMSKTMLKTVGKGLLLAMTSKAGAHMVGVLVGFIYGRWIKGWIETIKGWFETIKGWYNWIYNKLSNTKEIYKKVKDWIGENKTWLYPTVGIATMLGPLGGARLIFNWAKGKFSRSGNALRGANAPRGVNASGGADAAGANASRGAGAGAGASRNTPRGSNASRGTPRNNLRVQLRTGSRVNVRVSGRNGSTTFAKNTRSPLLRIAERPPVMEAPWNTASKATSNVAKQTTLTLSRGGRFGRTLARIFRLTRVGAGAAVGGALKYGGRALAALTVGMDVYNAFLGGKDLINLIKIGEKFAKDNGVSSLTELGETYNLIDEDTGIDVTDIIHAEVRLLKARMHLATTLIGVAAIDAATIIALCALFPGVGWVAGLAIAAGVAIAGSVTKELAEAQVHLAERELIEALGAALTNFLYEQSKNISTQVNAVASKFDEQLSYEFKKQQLHKLREFTLMYREIILLEKDGNKLAQEASEDLSKWTSVFHGSSINERLLRANEMLKKSYDIKLKLYALLGLYGLNETDLIDWNDIDQETGERRKVYNEKTKKWEDYYTSQQLRAKEILMTELRNTGNISEETFKIYKQNFEHIDKWDDIVYHVGEVQNLILSNEEFLKLYNEYNAKGPLFLVSNDILKEVSAQVEQTIRQYRVIEQNIADNTDKTMQLFSLVKDNGEKILKQIEEGNKNYNSIKEQMLNMQGLIRDKIPNGNESKGITNINNNNTTLVAGNSSTPSAISLDAK